MYFSEERDFPSLLIDLGHRLIISQPNSDGGEFDESKVVFGVLLVACGDGTEGHCQTKSGSVRENAEAST